MHDFVGIAPVYGDQQQAVSKFAFFHSRISLRVIPGLFVKYGGKKVADGIGLQYRQNAPAAYYGAESLGKLSDHGIYSALSGKAQYHIFINGSKTKDIQHIRRSGARPHKLDVKPNILAGQPLRQGSA